MLKLFASAHFNLILTACVFFLSFFVFLGSIFWLKFISKDYLENSQELPFHEKTDSQP